MLPARDDSSKEWAWFSADSGSECVFEVLLPDGHKLSPDWLRKIDTPLEDEGVFDVVRLPILKHLR